MRVRDENRVRLRHVCSREPDIVATRQLMICVLATACTAGRAVEREVKTRRLRGRQAILKCFLRVALRTGEAHDR
jgi:hypothetical protein